MAKETATGLANASNSGQTDSMAAARAARRNTRQKTDHLSANAKYALKTIQSARSGLKKAQDNLILGMDVPAELIKACANVNSAIGTMLFD